MCASVTVCQCSVDCKVVDCLRSEALLDFSCLNHFCRNGVLSLSRVADDAQGTSPAEYRGGFEKGKYHGYGEMK